MNAIDPSVDARSQSCVTRSWALAALMVVAAFVACPLRPRAAVLAQPQFSVQSRVLSNGLTVLVEERPDALTSGIVLVVRAGMRDDLPDRIGAIETLARAVVGGTQSHPTVESLLEDIHEVGGTAKLSVDVDLTQYAIDVPAEGTNAAIDMLADSMVNPRFGVFDTGEAVNEAAGGEYESIPAELAAELWPGHPATRSLAALEGDEGYEAVQAITYADLLTLRDRYFVARNMVLAVVGPVTASDVFARAERTFAPLAPGERHPIQVQAANPPNSGRKDERGYGDQAEILMGIATPGLLSPDYPAVVLLDLSLSGASGRLFRDVRSEHALAYDVDTQSVAFADVGAVMATATVEHWNAEAAVDRFTAVIDDLAANPPGEAELAVLRDRLRGQIVLERAVGVGAATADARNAMLGRPVDVDGLMALYAAVTPADMRRVAAAYFSSDRAILRVAARPTQPPQPEPAGPVEVKTDWTITATDNQFDVTRMAVPLNQPVTIKFVNDDESIHSWRLMGAVAADGRAVATPLVDGGSSATILFTLTEAGTYEYMCSVHPAEMNGKLTVVDESDADPGTAETPVEGLYGFVGRLHAEY